METQTTALDGEPTTLITPLAKKDKCRCQPINLLPDLTAFLTLLDPEHLEDLAEQCDLPTNRKEKNAAQQVHAIVRFIESNPGESIRLRNHPTRRNSSARSPYQFDKDKQYLLGQIGSSIWDIGVKQFRGQDQRQLSLRTDLPFQIEIDFGLACLLQNHLFGVRLIIEEDFVIPEGVTVITDLRSIRFRGRLSMQKNAQLYGTHRCGLLLEADRLSGIGAGGLPGSPHMREWPMISTSIRPLAEQPLQYEVVNPDYQHLWRVTTGTARVDGYRGHHATDPVPLMIEGAKGRGGSCDWWGLGGHTNPADGESHAGVQGRPGDRGDDGEDGHSAAALSVVVNTAFEGYMRFEARGGYGGDGGNGGRGQSLVSGAGGDVSRWCANVTKPGLGGALGRGGDGGPGGAGGNGGNGGTVRLSFPAVPDENRYRACVRKGEGGRGGHPRTPGSAFRGQRGSWLDLVTNEPAGLVEAPANYDEGPVPGSTAEAGPAGGDGWNGSIYVNGDLKVATNQGSSPNNFRYPVGEVVAGAPNTCWE